MSKLVKQKASHFATSLLFTLCLMISLGACGKNNSNQFLKGVTLEVTQQNSDSYFKLSSTFDLGNAVLGDMNVVILDPTTQSEKGSVQFSRLANGLSQISVLANTSLLTHGDATLGKTLPNGRELPFALGIQEGQVLGVKILDHSTLYLGGNTNSSLYLGVALGVKGFDNIMSNLPSAANIFFMGNFSSQVFGLGGIYGNATPGESGIAVFGKYTKTQAATIRSVSNATTTDYEIEKLDSEAKSGLADFFYGDEKTIEIY